MSTASFVKYNEQFSQNTTPDFDSSNLINVPAFSSAPSAESGEFIIKFNNSLSPNRRVGKP